MPIRMQRAVSRSAHSGSWRLGTVRMSERFLPPNGPAKRRQLNELREHIAGELAGTAWLEEVRERGPGRLVGIGDPSDHRAVGPSVRSRA